jgi:hypothetical protein
VSAAIGLVISTSKSADNRIKVTSCGRLYSTNGYIELKRRSVFGLLMNMTLGTDKKQLQNGANTGNDENMDIDEKNTSSSPPTATAGGGASDCLPMDDAGADDDENGWCWFRLLIRLDDKWVVLQINTSRMRRFVSS